MTDYPDSSELTGTGYVGNHTQGVVKTALEDFLDATTERLVAGTGAINAGTVTANGVLAVPS